MNLSEYYEQLPGATAPKTEFINRISELCNVKVPTVRLWIKGGAKPDRRNDDYDKIIEILAQETGIDKENLFAK